jgi:hypothetical protein
MQRFGQEFLQRAFSCSSTFIGLAFDTIRRPKLLD